MVGNVLLETPFARAEDLGDGAVLLRFTDGVVSSETARWAADTIAALADTAAAFVVDGCAAYDCNELYGLADRKDWDGLEAVAVAFQSLTGAIRAMKQPVVAALHGETSDLGIELGMSCDGVCEAEAVFAFALRKNRFTPMAGGLAQLTLRTYAIGADVMGCDIVPFLRRIYGQLYMGKPCAGIAEAGAKGIPFAMADTCGKEELFKRAKDKALFMAAQGYTPHSEERFVVVTGTTGAAALEIMAINMCRGGFISEEMFGMAADIASVLGGGDVPKGTLVSEAQLLKLEREAFVSACKRLGGKEATA